MWGSTFLDTYHQKTRSRLGETACFIKCSISPQRNTHFSYSTSLHCGHCLHGLFCTCANIWLHSQTMLCISVLGSIAHVPMQRWRPNLKKQKKQKNQYFRTPGLWGLRPRVPEILVLCFFLFFRFGPRPCVRKCAMLPTRSHWHILFLRTISNDQWVGWAWALEHSEGRMSSRAFRGEDGKIKNRKNTMYRETPMKSMYRIV